MAAGMVGDGRAAKEGAGNKALPVVREGGRGYK